MAMDTDWLLKPETLVDHFRVMRPLGRGGARSGGG